MPDEKKFQNSTLGSWMIENGAIVGSAMLSTHLLEYFDIEDGKQKFISIFLSGFLIIEFSIFLQKTLVEHVYADIPYFDKKKQVTEPRNVILQDWLCSTFPTHFLDAALKIVVLKDYKYSNEKFSPLAFLAKLALLKLIVDVVFYIGHRLIHTKPLYALIHKKHHEHKRPNIYTNFHFTFPDLLIEAFIPLTIGLLIFKGSGISLSRQEEALLTSYTVWYEIGCHAGKPLPTLSYFPPLSPLYRAISNNLDKHNIHFHDEHHAQNSCNYGITQWIDELVGTRRITMS